VIALSRQKLPFVTETFSKKNMSRLGAYEIIKTKAVPDVTLIASGSEVQIAIDAQKKLKNINITSKVISMPCQELFDKQSKEYREKIIDKESIKISIEAGSIIGWEKYVGPNGISLGMKSFGKSAPYKKIYEHFNLTSDNIVKLTRGTLDK
jgi:transketolase